MSFDPNAASSSDDGIFGLPYSYDESLVVYFPVPWEATTSYGGGTSNGPSAIAAASRQIDLYDVDVLKPYEAGLHLLPEDPAIRDLNEVAKGAALERVNEAGAKLNEMVYAAAKKHLDAGKIFGLIGGDHSTPFGSIQAHAKKYPGMGILHIDAHSDLRVAYEGYTWSHASILYNVLENIGDLGRTVQVGIRDFCEAEFQYCRDNESRLRVFYDRDLKSSAFRGERWDTVCGRIVDALPQSVYVTFDIDGLDPKLCPNTGTPVPGGLDFAQANYLIGAVARSGRKIVGFDLNEVAPGKDEWDANVGARMLYKLTGWTLASQGKAPIRS